MKKRLLATALLANAAIAQGAEFLPLDRPAGRHLADPAAHGKPTVVALWSTDCSHCKSNLRLFSDLARQQKNLRVVSIATEPASPEAAKVLDTLSLPGDRYAYGSDAPEALAYALDPRWQGELPRTLIFDGKGNKVAVSGTLNEGRLRQALGLPRRQ